MLSLPGVGLVGVGVGVGDSGGEEGEPPSWLRSGEAGERDGAEGVLVTFTACDLSRRRANEERPSSADLDGEGDHDMIRRQCVKWCRCVQLSI